MDSRVRIVLLFLWISLFTLAHPQKLSPVSPRLLSAKHQQLAHGFLPEVRISPELFVPGSAAGPFSIPTASGNFTYDPNSSNGMIIFQTFNNQSEFIKCMWTRDEYLDHLLLASPQNARYIFIPTGDATASDWMKDRLDDRMDALGFSPDQKSRWENQTVFSALPLSRLGNWVEDLLQEWFSSLDQIVIYTNQSTNPIQPPSGRLDGRWPWVMSSSQTFGNNHMEIVNFNMTICNTNMDENNYINKEINLDIKGKIALMPLYIDGIKCTPAERIYSAQLLGAVGTVFYANESQPLYDLNCEGDDCNLYITIPATMIDHSTGISILSQIQQGFNTSVQFTEQITDGFFFAIDNQNLLQETGYIMYPDWMFLVWDCEYFNWMDVIIDQLESKDEKITINVFNKIVLNGTASVNVTLPSFNTLTQYDTVKLYATLTCTSPFDSSCPAWDRIMSLTMCCYEDEKVIQQTCGQELGRWINPFGRGDGRWFTDVTPLLPLLDADKCTFTLSGFFNNEHWKPYIDIIVSKSNYDKGSELIPTSIVPLFKGATFNQSYNNRTPIYFDVPSWTKKVDLYAVITGHGSDNNNCGEFCVTSHYFAFNQNSPNSITFSNAGTNFGCAVEAIRGVVPSEYGTWLYGRDGWCDGLQVDPWVVDVTDQIEIGELNKVVYYGYFNGSTPHPVSNPGYIVMYSYAIFYGSSNSSILE